MRKKKHKKFPNIRLKMPPFERIIKDKKKVRNKNWARKKGRIDKNESEH